jgi:hypothetical protein
MFGAGEPLMAAAAISNAASYLKTVTSAMMTTYTTALQQIQTSLRKWQWPCLLNI